MARFSDDDTTPSPPGQPDLSAGGNVAGAGQAAATRARLLARTIEYDILPRLMRTHRPDTSGTVRPLAGPGLVSAVELRHFVDLVTHGSDADLRHHITACQARGLPVQRLLLDLLAPAARLMGEHWCSDECDFSDVTVAVGRLQQVLRELCASSPAQGAHRPGTAGRSILLTPCPGEQHTFGLSMVAEFFHQAGWDVTLHLLSQDLPPARLVRNQWFDAVGLTVGSHALLGRMARCVEDLRQASLNRSVPIIAGGPLFTVQPDLEAQLSVDAIIIDASAAPSMAERLVEQVKLRA